MDNKKNIMSWVVILGLLTLMTGGISQAAVNGIQEDFSEMPTVTATLTGTFSWVRPVLATDSFVSEPTSLLLRAGGGEGSGTASFVWALGGDYNFYANGLGVCTVHVSRGSTAVYIKVELLDSGDVKSEVQHNFSDWGTFHELTLPLNGDEIGIDEVRFTIARYTGTGSAFVYVDDFLGGTIVENCGDDGTVYLPGDFNADCQVDMRDLAMLASNWLGCNDPMNVNCE